MNLGAHGPSFARVPVAVRPLPRAPGLSVVARYAAVTDRPGLGLSSAAVAAVAAFVPVGAGRAMFR